MTNNEILEELRQAVLEFHQAADRLMNLMMAREELEEELPEISEIVKNIPIKALEKYHKG